MMRLKILNTRKVKEIRQKIRETWDAEPELDFAFLQSQWKGRIYIVNKDVSGTDISQLKIDTIGLDFGTARGGSLRLSFEGSQIVGPSARKNVAELTEEQRDEWIKGRDVKYDSDSGDFLIVKCGRDYMGCGKMRGGYLTNFVPKSRRLAVVAD